MNRLPVLALAHHPWDGPWMNRQQLLSRLAQRGWRVVYTPGPVTVWDRGSSAWHGAAWWRRVVHRDGVMVVQPGRLQAHWPRLRGWAARAERAHANALLRAARVDEKGCILYIFHPGFLPYVRLIRPRYIVYHAVDTYALWSGWTEALARAEQELLGRADMVIASAPGVAERFPAEPRVPTRVLLNGADAAAFARGAELACPEDLAAVPRPRIGYTGRITEKVDFPLILQIARQRPDWHWVFVGPVQERALLEDSAVSSGFRQCRGLANVHFLGEKDHGDLPAYVGHMDVNAMCYRQDWGWWSRSYPLKLHEYLAAGPPVIAADLDIFPSHPDVVDVARDAQSWHDAIMRALFEGGAGTVESRRRVAFANTWDSRVDDLERWLRCLVPGPVTSPLRRTPDHV